MSRFLAKLMMGSRQQVTMVVTVSALLLVVMPSVALAQWFPGAGLVNDGVQAVSSNLFSLDDIGQGVISAIAFGFSWLIALIAGLVVSILSWFLQVVLSISFGLVNSAPVKIGFPIVLAMANLFFVGALIAIAIATITRREEYGAKKVLWKVVVMAVMVNFGLVICGALLSISDETTKFFIDSINGGRDANGNVDYFKLADSVAGAFNPGSMIISTEDVIKNPALAKEDLSGWAVAGDDFGRVIKPIVGVLFTFATFVVIIITLATLNLMLLWRYVKLGQSLILLPLAWASWIFPTYQEHYKSWWTKFTKWAIFPPVVVFFLWLGLKTSEVMSNQSGEFAPLYESSDGNPLADFLGNLFTPIISDSLKALILFGIMMGGIVAAQELGVKFADAGYKAVEGAGNGAKKWAGRKADRITARPRAAVGAAATRAAARVAGMAEKRLPFLNKKKVLDDQGRVVKVDKDPEEKLSGRLMSRADQARDKVEERISPGGSLKQRKGETVSEWQERLAARNKKFAPSRTAAETEADWEARFNREATGIVQNNPDLDRDHAGGESYEAWRARIIAAHPDLARREEAVESAEEWRKKVDAAIEEAASKSGGKKDEKGLFASMWGGATQGFKKGTGHKSLTQKELNKLMEEKFGVHIEDGGGHGPAPSGGGGGSHGGGGAGAGDHH